MVSYYRVEDKNGIREGLEVYTGGNYVVGSKKSNYSRHYPITNKHSILELPIRRREQVVKMRSALKRMLGNKLLKI
jgi:hypothetical protein